MHSALYRAYSVFYSKSVLERLITYIFISEIVVKIILELGMGMWYFELSRQKQYLFFALVFFDYVLNIRNIASLKFNPGYIIYFSLGMAFVVVQGVLVGFLNRNKLFEIFNDTVPILVFVINAIWMQSYSERIKKVDIENIFNLCSVVIVSVCLFGYISVLIGNPSTSSAGGMLLGIYMPLFFANLITRKCGSYHLIAIFIVIILSIQDLNRTSIIFVSISSFLYFFLSFLRSPLISVLYVFSLLCLLSIGWSFISVDSNTYKRISSLSEVNLSERRGSIGERGEEFRSIRNKLSYSGDESVYFGLGHGGLYDVKHTHKFIKDNGHAHYSWALFNLRYGYLGYVYVALMLIFFVYHSYRSWSIHSGVGIFVALLCIQSLLYMMTYVNFVILIAGIQLYSGFFREGEGISSQRRLGDARTII